MSHNAENDAVPHGPDNPCEPKCHGWGIGCPCNPRSAEKDVPTVPGDRIVECSCHMVSGVHDEREPYEVCRVLPPGEEQDR